MNPSVVIKQLQQAINDYLRLSFETTTPFFDDMLERFLTTSGQIIKGPYLSIKLPFEQGKGNADFFPAVPLVFPPYKHQEIAFERLGVDFRSTLVATGTGSGKTECFQIPILNYCYQNKNQSGIKAIFIYPMNALASDQAGRLAKAINKNPNLKGMRAGIYVGDTEENPALTMEDERIISDKETLRSNPPDILLTNYKMLDFLLIRANDSVLWANNTPETLKFLVVDELHTFDGAQGTDLACLIRRLKARLETPKQHLVCVGTSATLGGDNASKSLIDYATAVFDEPFDEQSVISEYRQSLGSYLASSPVEYIYYPPQEKLAALQAQHYSDLESYIKAQARLWFGELEFANHSDFWRVELAHKLKKHFLFQNLLRLLDGKINDWKDLIPRFKKGLGIQVQANDEWIEQLLTSLVALVSVARDDNFLIQKQEDGVLKQLLVYQEQNLPYKLSPLLDVRMQLWLRELRRLVVLLPLQEEPPVLLFADDAGVLKNRVALPAIHCRDCGAMGLLTQKSDDDRQVSNSLDTIYRAFFEHSPKTCFLFPVEKNNRSLTNGVYKNLCGSCGRLNNSNEYTCTMCQAADGLLSVFLANNVYLVPNPKLGIATIITRNDCPFCQSKNSLLIVGARATSLSSVLVGQLSTSRFNNDKQLIAFSDAVQDTAHRAGFIAARTRSFGFRVALKYIIDFSEQRLSLSELIKQFHQHWLNELGQEKFIGTFIAADMEWLRDFATLKETSQLPQNSNLTSLIKQRLAFEIVSELGFRSRIGRSLERTQAAVCYVDEVQLEKTVEPLLTRLRENIGGLRSLDAVTLQRFMLGLIDHLRLNGGIFSQELQSYIYENADTGVFIHQKHLPNFSPVARQPVFLATANTKGLETLQSSIWYKNWLLKSLFSEDELHGDFAAEIYQIVLAQLIKTDVLLESTTKTNNTVWAINPDVLRVTSIVIQLRCDCCHHSQYVAENLSDVWQGNSCLQPLCFGHYQKIETQALNFYGQLYQNGEVTRVVAGEHTGLLDRDERAKVESSFKKPSQNRMPWDINLLSATPTLEMGVDIGDLSAVLLCSVPPAQANYLQRIGRAGRRDGNAINVTFANAAAHDLYFYSDPLEMMAGEVESPGVFLDACAVLERQYTAFCLDCWVKKEGLLAVIPYKLKSVLSFFTKGNDKFPYNFLNYIELNKTTLLEQFLALFDSDFGAKLSDFSIDWIKQFAAGDFSTIGSLSFRIQEKLVQQKQELDSLTSEVKRINTVIKKIKNNSVLSPQDKEDLLALQNEFSALEGLAKQIRNKDTLQFFTDEGLIPNYAFPEQGVLLRSVIYRSRKDNDGSEKSDSWLYEYERPAVAALSELAPSNTFYAGGRRVEITRIDMRVSQTETWRFCRSCHHSQCVDTGDEHQNCPRCADEWWSNVSQRQTMLRLKRVFASTADKKSRILDDRDDRNSQFFTRQLLIDFEPQAITAAWKIEKEDFPFGYEFISKADFREINTGQSDENSAPITIAGHENKRRGFKVCRLCGMVQSRQNEQEHTISCPTQNKNDAKNLVNGLYLYREFQSEAIRILLPITSGIEADIIENSFVAALHLGLKKKFGGRIDHLRVAQNVEPDTDSGITKRYLVIYDSIPGGTGYLKQLMTDKTSLLEVLTHYAMPILERCSCTQKEGADGCYRCLYVYSNSRNMNTISSKKIRDFIQTLRIHSDKITPVTNLRGVKISSLVESELEARFMEALKKIGKTISNFEFRPEFYNGKAGWYLRFSENCRYFLQPQVSLGEKEDVAVPSRADFIFYPLGRMDCRPIVIFTDGFKYHKDRVALDSAQRLAIVASNKFWVWSLFYNDVQNILDEKNTSNFDISLNFPEASIKAFAQHFSCLELVSLNSESSFIWLIQLLQIANQSVWIRYATMMGVIWFNAFNNQGENKDFDVTLLPSYAQQKQDLLNNFETISHSIASRLFLNVSVNKQSIQKNELDQLVVIFIFNDETELENDEDMNQWQTFLRLINLIQFQQNSCFFTRKGIAENIYDDLILLPNNNLHISEWEVLLSDAIDDEVPFILALSKLNLPVPQCSFELKNTQGEIIAEAFLAWLELKIAIIFDDFESDRGLFIESGWQVFLTSELQSDFQQILKLFE